jgi:DNA topoisomerase-2
MESKSERFVKLDHIDHILLRPDMYTGANGVFTRDEYVVIDEKISKRPVAVHNILLKIFDEILVNARDHSVRDPAVSLIRINISDTCFAVENDGKTLPIELGEYGGYIPEMVFGHLLTGSNFDDTEDRVVGGRNGLGAKLANIWSTKFTIHLSDGERVYKQTFTNNMKKIGKASIKPVPESSRGRSFTRITCYPDFARLGIDRITEDMRALMTRRVYDVAASARPIVKFGAKRVKCDTMTKYAKLVAPGVPHIVHETDRWTVVVFPHTGNGPAPRLGFVNGIATNAGTHIAHVASQVVKCARAAAKQNPTPAMVQDAFGLVVSATIVNPEFTNQQKETLTTPISKAGSSCPLPEDVLKKLVSKKFGLVARLDSLAMSKLDAATRKNDAKRTRPDIPKLDDAALAGSARSSECTLILCEGDSAKSLAIAGLSAIGGRSTFGVFPLRGKLLNVRDNETAGLRNAEIQQLRQILGLEHKKVYTSTDQLRYGRVLIMTDADADGSHIKGLLLNYFDVEFPGLLETPGFVAEFVTPLVKASRGRETKSFFSMQEYRAWADQTDDAAAWSVKYYKGLGTSTSKEARAYFENLDRHVISFTDDPDRTDALSLAFSKKRANDRKRWVSEHDGSGREYDIDSLCVSEFVNKDLINFSVADVVRSIPDCADGLKPSQRKVLFAAFKKKLDKDIKVAQFAGYVSEVAAYHHGEVSLHGTIVCMARDYVGSNNLNLLVPSGQFGSRLMGGGDAASARYIFTRLARETRHIFPARDDPVLDYLNEDGQSIEPARYIPIVPMALVNGATGIGTGYSCTIPNFDLADVVRATRAKIEGREIPPLIPSYRGFTGEIVECEGGYVARGRFSTRTTPRGVDVHITELPPGSWTNQYREWLKTLESVTRLVDESTETTVDLRFMCTDRTMLTHTGLKLETKLSTTNMTLFDKNGKIRRFSISEIFDEHYAMRYELYRKRKAHELGCLKTRIDDESNKLLFVRCIVDGKLVITNRPAADVEEDMTRLGIVEHATLLRLPVSLVTREKIAELENAVAELKRKLTDLEAMTIETMWLAELANIFQ